MKHKMTWFIYQINLSFLLTLSDSTRYSWTLSESKCQQQTTKLQTWGICSVHNVAIQPWSKQLTHAIQTVVIGLYFQFFLHSRILSINIVKAQVRQATTWWITLEHLSICSFLLFKYPWPFRSWDHDRRGKYKVIKEQAIWTQQTNVSVDPKRLKPNCRECEWNIRHMTYVKEWNPTHWRVIRARYPGERHCLGDKRKEMEANLAKSFDHGI